MSEGRFELVRMMAEKHRVPDRQAVAMDDGKRRLLVLQEDGLLQPAHLPAKASPPAGTRPAPGRRQLLPVRGLAAGLAAAATVLLAHLGLMPFWQVAAAGTAALLGATMLLRFDPDPDAKPEETKFGDEPGQVVVAARERLSRLKAANDAIPDHDLSRLMDDVCERGEKMLLLLEGRPSDLLLAKTFLEGALDSVTKVAERYADVHRRGADARVEGRFLEMLQEVVAAMDRQHALLVERKTDGLDLEMDVIIRRMKQEGLY
jgi:hypothetical protein